ncbi:MAG TPA: hypothetical protein VFH29_05380 [Anaerolineales bacterium]|nr:hypothetical protein [Anaerolineales bacterium]
MKATRVFALLGLFTGLLAGLCVRVAPSLPAYAQQPTGSIPTVTSTPSGPTVGVDPSLERVRVYSGPSSIDYPAVGVLLTGVRVPALGRAVGNDDWILIRYPGVPGSQAWVYALYVSLTGGGGQDLPRIPVPPTPTPASTPTIDPTLAAAFIPAEAATRLPTFTAAPPLAVPTFVDDTGAAGRIPVGLLILGFGLVGVIGTMVSFLRGR